MAYTNADGVIIGARGPARDRTEAFKEARILSIRLRPDCIVRVYGVPADLTETEAARVTRVLKAYSK